MIVALAIMGGFDVKDDRVRTLVYVCLAGSAAKEILSKMGVDSPPDSLVVRYRASPARR